MTVALYALVIALCANGECSRYDPPWATGLSLAECRALTAEMAAWWRPPMVGVRFECVRVDTN